MTELAPVFVNEERVRLQGDPKPQVLKIVNAAGRNPQMVRVFRLQSKEDHDGNPIGLQDYVDRTEAPSDPVWLNCVDRGEKKSPGNGESKTATTAWGGGKPREPEPSTTRTPGTGTPPAPPPRTPTPQPGTRPERNPQPGPPQQPAAREQPSKRPPENP